MLEQLVTFRSTELEHLRRGFSRRETIEFTPYLAIIPNELNPMSRIDGSRTKGTLLDPHFKDLKKVSNNVSNKAGQLWVGRKRGLGENVDLEKTRGGMVINNSCFLCAS